MDLLKEQLNRRYIANNINNCKLNANKKPFNSCNDAASDISQNVKTEPFDPVSNVKVETMIAPKAAYSDAFQHVKEESCESYSKVKVETIDTPKSASSVSVSNADIASEEAPKDPFAFSDSNDTSSRQSSDSNTSAGLSKEIKAPAKNGNVNVDNFRVKSEGSARGNRNW